MVIELLCSTSNPANGTTATAGNTGFLAVSTAAGGSKTFSNTVGINSNTGLEISSVTGTNQARTVSFAATPDLELTHTFKTPATNPAAAVTFVAFRHSSGVAFRLQWYTDGRLLLFDNASVNQYILAAGVMANGTNYTIQSSFNVDTSSPGTGTVTVKVLNASGAQVGTTYTTSSANLGTNNLTQMDFDPNNQTAEYGISEIRYDPTTSGSLLAPWIQTAVTVNATPNVSYASVVTPAVSAESAVTGGVGTTFAYASAKAPAITALGGPVNIAAAPDIAYARTASVGVEVFSPMPALPTNQMWFGTQYKMQPVRVPSQGMQRTRQGYSSSYQLENGGMYIYEPTLTKHLEYKMEFGTYEATGSGGLDVYADYAQGFYGPGPFYFSDPMYYDQNLFSYQWSAPGMSPRGGTVVNTTANSVNQPTYSMQTYILDSVANNTYDTSAYNPTILPIPPGYTLWLGWSGSASASGVIRMESWISGSNSPAASSNLTPLSVTGTTRMNTSVSSAVAEFVKIGYARSASGSGANVTVTSMTAQLWPTGVTPTLTGNFITGQGNNGCKFDGGAVQENYVMRDTQGRNVHYKGLSFSLIEVGSWQ